MIESIYQIGQAVRQGSEGRRAFLESLAKEAPRPSKGNPAIAILNIDTNKPCLSVEIHEISEAGQNSAAHYLWVGNAAGANSDQDRVTTDNLSYLVSQTIPNLLMPGRISDESSTYQILEYFAKEFYLDLGPPRELGASDGGNYRRYRKIWDLQKLGIPGPTLHELQEMVRNDGNAKNVPGKVADAIREHFRSQMGNDRLLFTLKVDGHLLVDTEAYQAYLESVLVDTVFDEAQEGYCHLTGKKDLVTSNMTRFEFKYYITDKLGFASGATEAGFPANFGISKDAYISLLVGERFVRRQLGFRLAGTNVYVIPDFYTQNATQAYPGTLRRLLSGIKEKARYDVGVQDEISETLEEFNKWDERTGYSLNLLFYKQNKANFKVLRLIQDIPDYRLDELREQGSKTSMLGQELFGGAVSRWVLTLQKMYFLLPVRKSDNDYLSKPVLDFYEALIAGGLIARSRLVNDFVEIIHVHRFGNYAAYQISQPKDGYEDYTLTQYLAQTNLLLSFLRDIDQLKENEMDQTYLESLSLTDAQRKYLTRLNYGPQQTALYLLGTLVGQIGNAQYRLGPGGKDGSKNILEKINYQGMTLSRVQRLATELFDKLRQYRDSDRRPLLQHNEATFAQAQTLLTQYAGTWTLTPAENVYYILSGYSHATYQAMSYQPKPTTNDTNTREENATQ